MLGLSAPKLSALERLSDARLRLCLKHPFYGQMALRLELIDVTDQGWCKTAATDGSRLFYNAKFVDLLSVGEVMFLFGHELYHCIYEHFLRRDGRKPRRWNEANDYAINLILRDEKIGIPINKVKILMNDRFKGMHSEKIYDILDQENKEPQDTFDVHLDLDDGSDGDGGTAEGGGKSQKPTISAADMQDISDAIREAIMSAAASCQAGTVPEGIMRLIKNFTESKMDWREHLDLTFQSLVKNDFTWMRPNRKGWHMDAILPGLDNQAQCVEAAIAIDTSGSINTDMLQDFLGEIHGIMDQFTEYKLHIWQFDTKIYGHEIFESNDGKDLREYKIRGGGGTSFSANWDYMKRNDISPQQLVMFTDGQPHGSWGDPNYVDTLFIIHTHDVKAPFGKTVKYDKKSKRK